MCQDIVALIIYLRVLWDVPEEDAFKRWSAYRAAHEGLDRLHQKIIKSANTARVLTIVWVHGHYEMALGKKAPAEWFDVERFGELAVKAVF